MHMRQFIGGAMCFSLSLLSAPAVQADDILYIAGVNPSIRPPDAPVVTTITKDAEWYSRALYGVEKPYPYSLHFLEDQGNWFTPFNHPGMTDRYDLRGWFSKP